MAFELVPIKNAIRAELQDNAKLISDSELEQNIENALIQLNNDKPRIVSKDIAGDNSQDYALPSEFIKRLSDVSEVEAPAGNNPPTFRARTDDWFLYEDPTKPLNDQRLRFKQFTPQTTNRLTALDVDTIDFQTDTARGAIIRYTFNTAPDFSAVEVGDLYTATLSTNSSNDGSFFIVTVNNASNFIEVLNEDRSDNTDDEATDSPSEGVIDNVDIIRLTIKTSFTVTRDESNLDQISALALVYKSLVFAFRSLSSRFSQTIQPGTILADAVDPGAIPQNYLFLAERYETSYKQITGLSAPVMAAHAMAEADIIFAHGEDFLFHPSLTR